MRPNAGRFPPLLRNTIAGAAWLLCLWSDGRSGAQIFQNLHDFTGAEGSMPQAKLIQARDGNLYGTASYGGRWGRGAVFKITLGGEFTPLASFDGTNGWYPYGALLEASDGNFYGTTVYGGGYYNRGVVFKMSRDGALTVIGNFIGDSDPVGDLVEGPDGLLYGVTSGGGDYNSHGALFRISTNGWPPWLGDQAGNIHLFYGGDGLAPSGGLLLSRDGNFYGVTAGGGADGYGTIFRFTTNGEFATIASFFQGPGNAVWPIGKLLEASDGSFYGAAGGGFHGTVFKMTPDGTLTTFDRFYGYDGSDPVGGLIQANDGYLYGAAYDGGHYPNRGTIFRLALGFGCSDHTWMPCGNLTGVFELGVQNSGLFPYAGLVQGRDGNLYGTTAFGGAAGGGTIFRIIMPGPLLNLAGAGQNLVLSWRTNYTGYLLQSATDLARNKWADCTNPASVIGEEYFVTNSVSGPARFFRLSRVSQPAAPDEKKGRGHSATHSYGRQHGKR